MLQFYFLSIVLNFIAGAILVFGKDADGLSDSDSKSSDDNTDDNSDLDDLDTDLKSASPNDSEKGDGEVSKDSGLDDDLLADDNLDIDDIDLSDDAGSSKSASSSQKSIDDEFSDLIPDGSQRKATSNNKDSAITQAFLNDGIFSIVVAALCVFVGFVKLLQPVSGIPIFGDFLPFIAGFAAGACLLMRHFSKDIMLPSWAHLLFVDGKRFVGFFCVLVGFLHFICPSVLLF